MVPDEQLHAVIEELARCACGGSSSDTGASSNSSSDGSGGGSSSRSSSSSGGDRGSGNTREGGRGWTGAAGAADGGSGCQPDHLTVRALLHRLSRGDMHAEVNSMMQLLLRAGLPPNYKSFLPWASFHARRGSVGGVRHVMEQVEAHEGRGAVGGHYYVQLIRVRRAGGGGKGAAAGRGPPACLPLSGPAVLHSPSCPGG